MDFRILGPFEIRDGDRVVEVPRQKHRALLAVLLLRAGEVVSSERLVEDLWGEDPPASAKASLQNFVSQLRRTVGPDVLVTRPSGYLLDVDPERVDLRRFERLLAEARRTTGAERAAGLRAALELWRGPALSDLLFEPFAQEESERLAELETGAQEDLVDVELELGHHAQLVRRIESLVARNPLRERLRGQLMLALYRCDRQAEALDVYQATRQILVEELGIEPSAGLRELEQAILRQDPALGLDAAAADAVPGAHELRKRATVLFAEIAVSPGTDDAEAVHRAGSRALEEMRAAAEYHGGSVARAAADELLAVFGVPAAHEDDPLRAARAALQMRRALETMAADGIGIELRAAIATGELMLNDGAEAGQAGGRPVTLSRRLAETAPPGAILVDLATAALARAGIETEETEPREVRGEAEPVPCLQLVGAGAATRPGSGAPMVGRERELAQLLAAFAEARDERHCRLVTVAGEAGIGKTRLSVELSESLRGQATVLVGRCVMYGEGSTFLPLREAIVQAAGEDPRAAIQERLGGDEHADLVAERVAELVGGTGGIGPTGEAFWAVRRFLEALAEERPLVLLFDDVHWAEPTFLDLVEYLEQWSQGVPLLVVCLTRPELLAQRPAWTAGRIALKPLAVEDVATLVERIAGGQSPEARARIVEIADGNPLFAEQLVAHAAEGPGALDSVPPSLEALLLSRIDRLPAGERAVLERAAVVGREFWHGAVLHLSSSLDVPSVGRHLLELARKGLIRPGRPLFPREDGFRFHHVLIRDVAYASVPRELRAELHERVADWLDAQAPEQDELIGYHLEHAYLSRVGQGPPDRQARSLAADAGERLADAGIRAAKRGDNAATRNLLGRAAALLSDPEVARRDLLAELGLVVWRAGELDRAHNVFTQALEVARAARDRRAELRAKIELGHLRIVREPEGGADELLEVSRTAIPVFEELGADRSLGRAWYASASVHGVIHCQYGACEEATLEALFFFLRSGWPPAACLQELAASHFYGPTPVEEGIRNCRKLLEEADLGSRANVLVFLAGLEAMRGEFDEARRCESQARSLYEQLGWTVTITTSCDAILGAIELLAGRADVSAAVLAKSCAVLEGWQERCHLATQAAQVGEALYREGRYDEAARWAGVSEECAASDDASAQYSWRALSAKVLARSGETAVAEPMAREAARLAGKTDALSQHGDVLLDLAEVLRMAGNEPGAVTEIELALELFERKGNTVSSERARRLLAEPAAAG